MQYPNGRYFNASPGRFFGGTTEGYAPYSRMRGDRLNRFVNGQWSRVNGGLPSGYGVKGIVPPIRVGGLSAADGSALTITPTGSGSIGSALAGTNTILLSLNTTATGRGALAGTNAIALTNSSAAISSVSTLISGSTTLTLTNPAATVTLNGRLIGSTTATLSNPSALLVGNGASLMTSTTLSINVSGTILATGTLAGSISPYTELSPQNLASAVWSSVAASNNIADSMGAKVNNLPAPTTAQIVTAMEASTVIAKESSVQLTIALSA